ncbi:Deoxycytidine triphosphate deaminase [Clostridium sp. C105KSO15]|nr:Deoxycytidine triphosphate deaminase [Clostridium sp. C105KSO15]
MGHIEILPFTPRLINENSYTVTLGNELLLYTAELLDTAKKNPTKSIVIPKEGMLLEKGKFCVGCIEQYVGSDYYVPILHGIPQVARKGMFIHITANLIDIGNHCNFSLQIYPTENIIVYPGMEIAQISFWKVCGTIKLYSGKYKNVRGPKASQSYKHTER